MIAPGDEQVEALLDKAIFKPPSLKCVSGNRVERFCINEACQNDASCCNDDSCIECEKKHEYCPFYDLKRLAKRVEDRISLGKRTVRDIFRLENDLLNQLSTSRRILIEKADFLKLDEGNSAIIDSLYFKENPKGLKGKQMKALYSELSVESKQNELERYVQDFKKKGEKIMASIVELRQELLDQLLGKKKHQSIAIIASIHIDSKILSQDAERKKKTEFLLNSLDRPKHLKLLFRASQNNFKAAEFHLHCDNIPNTITIVRTEFNRTIAAYTPLPWKSVGGWVADPSRRSFLLQLELEEKMTLVEGQEKYQIYDHPKGGPVFGGGQDLLIADACNQNSFSYANFPTSYNCGGKYKKSQDSYMAFSGANNGQNFRVRQYEVFQVIK